MSRFQRLDSRLIADIPGYPSVRSREGFEYDEYGDICWDFSGAALAVAGGSLGQQGLIGRVEGLPGFFLGVQALGLC